MVTPGSRRNRLTNILMSRQKGYRIHPALAPMKRQICFMLINQHEKIVKRKKQRNWDTKIEIQGQSESEQQMLTPVKSPGFWTLFSLSRSLFFRETLSSSSFEPNLLLTETKKLRVYPTFHIRWEKNRAQ